MANNAEYFYAEEGISQLDFHIIQRSPAYSRSWEFHKMAEVLIPDFLSQTCFSRVVCKTKELAEELEMDLYNPRFIPCEVDKNYFYRRNRAA